MSRFKIIFDRSYSTVVRTEQMREGDPEIYYTLGKAKAALDNHLRAGIEELQACRKRLRETTLTTIENHDET